MGHGLWTKNSCSLAGILLATALCGCSGVKAYTRPGFLERSPRRVAVLPFVITYPYDLASDESIPSSHMIGRNVFREAFARGFAPFGFEDMKLTEVDQRLIARWGPLEDEAWRTASPQELGTVLGTDAFIVGEIQHIVHIATPMYTESSLNATLKMIDADSGDELWRTNTHAAERGGIAMKKGQVVELVKDQFLSHNSSKKFLRVAEEAVRRAVQGIPNPPLTLGDPPPRGNAPRLAALPFETKKKSRAWARAGDILHHDVVTQLQQTSFEIIEPQRVKAALAETGWRSGDALPDSSVMAQVAQRLGADVMLSGTVTTWDRRYMAVESWVSVGLRLELVNASTGQLLWSKKETDVRHAGISKGPTGYKSVVTSPIMGLRMKHVERVANNVAQDLVESMTAADEVATYLHQFSTPPPS